MGISKNEKTLQHLRGRKRTFDKTLSRRMHMRWGDYEEDRPWKPGREVLEELIGQGPTDVNVVIFEDMKSLAKKVSLTKQAFLELFDKVPDFLTDVLYQKYESGKDEMHYVDIWSYKIGYGRGHYERLKILNSVHASFNQKKK